MEYTSLTVAGLIVMVPLTPVIGLLQTKQNKKDRNVKYNGDLLLKFSRQ